MKSSIQIKIRRAKRTMLGRTLCRLAGDQAGAVLMEYVILGVLVAAAVTLAVIYFGEQITGGFRTMRGATAGRVDEAEAAAKANQDALAGQAAGAEGSRKTIAPGK